MAQDLTASFSATASGTNAGATATLTAGGNTNYMCVTHVSGVSDAAANLQILDGSTVKWTIKVQANVPFFVSFAITPILCAAGNSAIGKIDASTAACSVNIVAFRVSKV